MIRASRVIALLVVLVLGSVTTKAATMDYLGMWNSTTTYAVSKVVKHNGRITKRTTPLRTLQHQALSLTLRHQTGMVHHGL